MNSQNTSSPLAVGTTNICDITTVDSSLVPEALLNLTISDLRNDKIQETIITYVRANLHNDFIYEFKWEQNELPQLLIDFHTEQVTKGTYHLDGVTGRKYQSFVDYWVYVSLHLGSQCAFLSQLVCDPTGTSIGAYFYSEQKSKGTHHLDGKIGREYQSFIKYWEHVSKNLGSPVTKDLYNYDHHDQGLKCLSYLPKDTGKGVYIAGSSALAKFETFIDYNSHHGWKAGDVDMFYVNCPTSTRMEIPPAGLDMVFCKEKTVQEVLLNFDLPCCRVGFDLKYNFYISIQALCAIFTRKMYLPKYMEFPKSFKAKLDEYDNSKASYAKNQRDLIVRRFYERVKKYQSRGFATKYAKHEYVLPWMKNRFTYIDFENHILQKPQKTKISESKQFESIKNRVNKYSDDVRMEFDLENGVRFDCVPSYKLSVITGNSVFTLPAGAVGLGDVLFGSGISGKIVTKRILH